MSNHENIITGSPATPATPVRAHAVHAVETEAPKPAKSKKSSGTGGQLVALCEACRKAYFMLETPNMTGGPCDACGTSGSAFQYARADVRMEHLSEADQLALEQKFDSLAAVATAKADAAEVAEKVATDAAEAAAAEKVRLNDVAYEAAVASRKALDDAEKTATTKAEKAEKKTA